MVHEHTFVMVKPDGVQRGLIGELVSRLERKGLKAAALKMMRIDKDLASQHYAEHEGKPFYPGLIDFITSGPVVAMVWQGEKAISIVRKVLGATSPDNAEPGSVRGDFAINTSFNLMHASDGPESATREINLFFKEDEIQDYKLTIGTWLHK
jgi:nucleoside-diphosphate kinase